MRKTQFARSQAMVVDENRWSIPFTVLAGLTACVLLLCLVGCGSTTSSPVSNPKPVVTAVATDYSQAQNWETLPNANQPVDVLFFYPTTYSAPSGTLGSTWTPGWNQQLSQAYADTSIKFHVSSKTGVFRKAGTNLYVPYFQQASGLDVLSALLYGNTPQNVDAANAAMDVAYRDVSNAFDYYLAHFNKDNQGKPRPFILAGHSQGSNLLLMLLQKKFSDPSLRKQLVAAYVVGWSVTTNDMNSAPNSLPQVGVCGIPVTRQTGCIVTYNTQSYPGDWTSAPGPVKLGLVQKNAYSVNPLTGVGTAPGDIEAVAAQNSANLGAVFYSGQLGTVTPVPFTINPDTGDSTYEIASYTGAQSNQGALVVDVTALPSPGDQPNLASPYNKLPFFHNYDYNFFYRNLEQDVINRIAAYQGQ